MTGMEVLEKKISERYGLSLANAKQVTRSKAAEKILTVLAEEAGLLEIATTDMIDRKQDEAETLLYNAQNAQRRALELKHMVDREKSDLSEKEKKLEELERDIMLCKNDEAKDRIRMLEIFKRCVSVKTPQNNTAFINGCAAILSGCMNDSRGENENDGNGD